MRITWDSSVDAAYIYLDEGRESGYVKRTEPVDLAGVQGEVLLDFDADGKLVGVEVLGASHVLPDHVIRTAETPPLEVRSK